MLNGISTNHYTFGVTHQPRDSLNPFESFDQDLRTCRKCETILAGRFVDERISDTRVMPRPIVVLIQSKPIMLIGQAPGLTEYETGKPFQGPAGQGIRAVFAECGLPPEKFSSMVHTSAVTKCFPGSKKIANKRKPGFRREDEKPSAAMVSNCRPFLERQLALVDPKIVVLLGSFPLQAYLRMRGEPASNADLARYVGRTEQWEARKVISLPHTSGSSRWLNSHANRDLFARAKQRLCEEFAAVLD